MPGRGLRQSCDQGVWPGAVAVQLGLEEGGEEEGMGRQLGDTDLARVVGAGEAQPVRPQQVEMARIGAVVAVVALHRALGAQESGRPRAVAELDRTLMADQRTGERNEYRVLGGGQRRVLAVPGVRQAAHRTGVLQQGVLETPAGTQKRNAFLAGGTDGRERPRLAAVRAAGQHPDRVEPVDALRGLLRGDPVGVQVQAVAVAQGVEQNGDTGVGADGRIPVADQGDTWGVGHGTIEAQLPHRVQR